MANTAIFDSVESASPTAGVCRGEEEQTQDTVDQTCISLSNRGIETIDFDRYINSQDSESPQQPRMPHIPLSILFSSASRIVRLDLSRNKLTSIPKELFGENTNASLSFLNVGRNQLKGLPSEIGNCKQLKTLIVLSNKVRPNGFPFDVVASLPLLEVLDLRWNQKMNNQSSRRRLEELFKGGGSEKQEKKFQLLLSPTNAQNNYSDPNTPQGTKKKLSACDRDANDLRSQLEPLSTPQLRKRLHRTFGVTFDDADESAYDRENIMRRLLECYNNNYGRGESDHAVPQRTVRYERGVPLDPILLERLLEEMEAVPWPRTTRERPKIAAEGYVILQRPPPSTPTTKAGHETSTSATNNKAKREAEKLKRFLGIWEKAVEAIESVDEEFARRFTALAVTKNFKGSPHIDTLNIAPFYGLSLGDFCNGGKLCVECSATCVAEIDTRGRFAKVDGRFCHWVSDYKGTRYSLIYYVTHGDVVPQTTAIFKPPSVTILGDDEEEKHSCNLEWVPPPTFVP